MNKRRRKKEARNLDAKAERYVKMVFGRSRSGAVKLIFRHNFAAIAMSGLLAGKPGQI